MHKKAEHDGETCQEELSTKSDSEAHMKAAHEKQKTMNYECNICNEHFEVASELDNHNKISHEENINKETPEQGHDRNCHDCAMKGLEIVELKREIEERKEEEKI